MGSCTVLDSDQHPASSNRHDHVQMGTLGTRFFPYWNRILHLSALDPTWIYLQWAHFVTRDHDPDDRRLVRVELSSESRVGDDVAT